MSMAVSAVTSVTCNVFVRLKLALCLIALNCRDEFVDLTPCF